MRHCRRRDHREDGVATILAVVLAGLLAVVGVLAGGLVAIVDTHRRSQSAADLAALAGATALAAGADACPAAGSIAGRNGAELVACRVIGRTVAVIVTVPAPGALGALPDPRARARAGPAAPPGLAPTVPLH